MPSIAVFFLWVIGMLLAFGILSSLIDAFAIKSYKTPPTSPGLHVPHYIYPPPIEGCLCGCVENAAVQKRRDDKVFSGTEEIHDDIQDDSRGN